MVTNLKPAPRKSDVFELNKESQKCDLKQHFKEFMSTTSKDVKRARSFSQPRCEGEGEQEQIKNKSVSRKSSRKEYSVEKCVEDGEETEKVQLRPVRLRLSRPSLRGEAKPPSESGSERTSTASTETDYSDKPVPYELDNKFENDLHLPNCSTPH